MYVFQDGETTDRNCVTATWIPRCCRSCLPIRIHAVASRLARHERAQRGRARRCLLLKCPPLSDLQGRRSEVRCNRGNSSYCKNDAAGGRAVPRAAIRWGLLRASRLAQLSPRATGQAARHAYLFVLRAAVAPRARQRANSCRASPLHAIFYYIYIYIYINPPIRRVSIKELEQSYSRLKL